MPADQSRLGRTQLVRIEPFDRGAAAASTDEALAQIEALAAAEKVSRRKRGFLLALLLKDPDFRE